LLRQAVAGLELALTARQFEQLAIHFSLLLRWNRKINLTSLRRPEEIATRHFEESLFLARLVAPLSPHLMSGHLVDVGSGAGFPGLPLKIAWPDAAALLLEPNKKKTAFLKEVIRSCGLAGIEARSERLEDAARGDLAGRASLVTLRAVKPSRELLADLKRLLASESCLALFVGAADARDLSADPCFHWEAPVPIPRSQNRVILLATP
jgi:16S rRNA (guanine527-N7)-methyltransferase